MTAPPHAVEAFAPEPAARRRGIALCLSGGGYRATLFHLGGLRRLHELGVLPQVDVVTSVSGGSITAAFLARAVVRAGGSAALRDFDAELAAPLRALTRRNTRTPALLRRFLPWNWFRSDTGVRGLAAAYRSALRDFPCSALPVAPRFVFSATDMAFGVDWTFERETMGDYEAGRTRPRPSDDVPLATAASSCFPPIFNPLGLRLDPASLTGGHYRRADRDRCIRGLRLTDGGMYDNLGLEPVWKSGAVVLVSDGGGPFERSADQGLFWRVTRYSDLLYRQVGALRRRWLISGFITGALQGTYWGVSSCAAHYTPGAPGYPDDIADNLIAKIRTDLDAFSDAEAAVLENHGYTLADAAVQRHLPALATTRAPLAVPHPAWDWSNLFRLKTALARSGRRQLLGRFRS